MQSNEAGLNLLNLLKGGPNQSQELQQTNQLKNANTQQQQNPHHFNLLSILQQPQQSINFQENTEKFIENQIDLNNYRKEQSYFHSEDYTKKQTEQQLTDGLKNLLFSSKSNTTPASVKKFAGFRIKKNFFYLDFENDEKLVSEIPLDSKPISLVPSKIVDCKVGNLICVDRNFICYAVRGGKIRVIHQRTGVMSLLKGHEAQLFDIKILETGINKSSLLSICEGGDFVYWNLEKLPENDEIKFTLIFKIKSTAKKFIRVEWSKTEYKFCLSTSHSDFFSFDLQLFDYPLGSVFDIEEISNLNGAARVSIENNEEIKDISFSTDGSVLAVASSKMVHFYSTDIKNIELLRKFMLPSPVNDEIMSLLLCSSKNQNIHYTGPLLMILSFKNNSELCVYNLLNFEKLGFLSFGFGPNKNFENKFANFLYVEEAAKLIYCCAQKSSIFVLSVSTSVRLEDDERVEKPYNLLDILLDNSSTRNIKLIGEANFEYLIGFSISDPILSLVSERSNEDGEDFNIFAIQPKAVQQYHITSEVCLPPDWESSGFLKCENYESLEVVEEEEIKTPTPNLMKQNLEEIVEQAHISTEEIKECITVQNDQVTEINSARLTKSTELDPMKVDQDFNLKKRVSFSDLTDAGKMEEFDNGLHVRIKSPPPEDALPAPILVDELDLKRKNSGELLIANTKIDGLSDSQFNLIFKELRRLQCKMEENKASIGENLKIELADVVEKRICKSMQLMNEKALVDVIPKLLNRPKVVEAIANSVSTSVKPVVEKLLKESFKNIFMPGMEKAVQAMFTQIHVSLEKGLEEVFQSHQVTDQAQLLILQKLEKVLCVIQEKVITSQQESGKISFESMQEFFSKSSQDLNSTLQATVSNEIRKVIDNNSGINQLSATPNTPFGPFSSEFDIRVLLDEILESKNYEHVFTKVLGSSDLNSVVYVISKVSVKDVFNGEEVLLSQPGNGI
ncbi:enhancer of mRNA decapping 4 [Lobulomyces angularis]|nr:enhancer of mRNA decapping 4 [Lobulomyces angularis]